MWDDLNMREKAAMMRIAIKNGITDIDSIKNSYNEFANGGSIHIKKANRGKFTDSANRAGMGVQEFARHVLANKDNYSTTQIKRANFARNAAKWHADGGNIDSDNYVTPKSVPNEFNLERSMDRMNIGESPFYSNPDFNNIKTTRERGYNPEYIDYINEQLIKKGYNNVQRSIILGNIIEESGGNPLEISDTGKYKGLLQWGPKRFSDIKSKDPYNEINRQLDYFYNTINNLNDKKSWTHGGSGSGYKHNYEPYDIYNLNIAPVNKRHRAFSYGYVRPKGKDDSVDNRYKVVNQVYNILSR